MTITNNALITIDGLEVYQSDIDVIADDYINSLPDPSMIYKAPCFKGLLLNIYNLRLKDIIQTDKHNRQSNNNNYSLLDDVFNNIYIPLVYRYCMIPTIQEFCVFVGIDNANLTDVKNGFYRSNNSKANPENTQTVKKWFSVCESALVSNTAQSNSIGSIFLLKSNYQYRDNVQQIEIVNGSGTQATPEQIAEKYADIAKPRLIDAETS